MMNHYGQVLGRDWGQGEKALLLLSYSAPTHPPSPLSPPKAALQRKGGDYEVYLCFLKSTANPNLSVIVL